MNQNLVQPDSQALRQFKPELDRFIKDFVERQIYENKIGIAQKKADDALSEASRAATVLTENSVMIKEELLPGALDLAIKAKEKDEIAHSYFKRETFNRY